MEKVTLNIDEDVFSDVYWKICDVSERFRVVYGGTGAGKSFTVAQDEVLRCLEGYEKILWIRKVASTIKDSVFASVKNRVEEFGCSSYIVATQKPYDINFTNTGSQILFRGLDDPEKMKSIEGITRIVIEEASELDYEDFKELNRRVRGVKNIQITLLFNPIDEDHWLKKHFFDQVIKNAKLIHTTHWDNPFLTQEDRDEIEAMKDYDENQYNIYALGQWGKLKTGNEFLPKFSYPKHTGKVKYLPNKPIHASFDFNVLPYMPCVLAQVQENVVRWRNPVNKKRYKTFAEGYEIERVTQIRVFRNILGKQGDFPENTTKSVCEKILMDYEKEGADLFLYGDASGKYRIAGKGDATNFKEIEATLKPMLNNASMRVPTKNPSVLKARDFLNRIFDDQYPIEIIIDEDLASELARDVSTIMLGADGILKEYVKDKKTGIRFQKNSHLHDALKYLVVELFKELFKSHK